MRVLRVYHGGRIASHRARDRAIAAAGHEVVLVVPRDWPEAGSEAALTEEDFRILELPVVRPGDVNRHRYADDDDVRRVLSEVRPDVVDLHAEPVSVASRQWLAAVEPGLPVLMYTAQNIDKRWPPPFHRFEHDALSKVTAMYPCSRQAASVVRGKGFSGRVEVLPLGYDPELFHPGEQSLDDDVLRLGLVGRMVPEKGVLDAVSVLAAVSARRPARLALVGDGPEVGRALSLAGRLGVADRLDVMPWVDTPTLATLYRSLHVVLVPSVATTRWVEQFGRVIVEGQASGAVVAGYHSGTIPEVSAGAGLLAAEGDVVGLCNAVSRLVASSGKYDELRRRGIELCRDRTWAQVGSRHARLIETCGDSSSLVPAVTGRQAARREFGATAAGALGDTRPFAIPVLRDLPGLGRHLGAVLDAAGRRRN